MNTNRLVVGLAMAALLMVGPGSALAISPHGDPVAKHITGTFYGTFESNQIDTNGDGGRGFQFGGLFDSTEGSGYSDGVGESVPLATPCLLPGESSPTGFSFAVLVGTYSVMFQSGDMWMHTYPAGDPANINCFDGITGLAYFDGTANITGGAGKYAGATGTFHATCVSRFTYGPDNLGNYAGNGNCTFEADIN